VRHYLRHTTFARLLPTHRSPPPRRQEASANCAQADLFLPLNHKREANVTARGIGPAAAAKRMRLEELTPSQRTAWIEEARLDAILGGLRLSIPSLRSGLRCYLAFVSKRCVATAVFGDCNIMLLFQGACCPGCETFFPPRLKVLLAWTTMFRSGGTLRNYLGYVKTGCIIVGANTGARRELAYSDRDFVLHVGEIFDEPALMRAKASVDKGCLFKKRKELWIQRHGLVE
jgi:hypothetical protein